jgi:hypothetical protein
MAKKRMARHLLEQVSGRGKRHAIAAAASNIDILGRVDQSLVANATPKNHRERDENYHGVIYLHVGWRVIVCRDGIQWIIQSKRNSGRRLVEWKGRAYCTTRTGVIREWRRLTGDGGAFLVMELPDQIERLT